MRVYRLVQVVKNSLPTYSGSSATVYRLVKVMSYSLPTCSGSWGTVCRLLRSGTVSDLFRSCEKAQSNANCVT